ncbi:hypothetical protein OG948_15045 [Embleya sp. NBC_00888]|uniref:hypothetical protein n=1 Tax=Embleya sp. NBC_00888 TaxID=2975960 RepID=UPI00386EA266|nr:hypothetical protein OG948_15045 [Embleya sp. NBC_00888]
MAAGKSAKERAGRPVIFCTVTVTGLFTPSRICRKSDPITGTRAAGRPVPARIPVISAGVGSTWRTLRPAAVTSAATSEFAFAKALEREYGTAPGTYRRTDSASRPA